MKKGERTGRMCQYDGTELVFSEKGTAVCPHCGTEFNLQTWHEIEYGEDQ